MRYDEAAYSGPIYVMDSDAVTLASANTTKGALGTAKLVNGFYNPVGSGVNARILRVSIATTSGTPAGPFFYNFLTGAVINSTVTGTIRALSPLQNIASKMNAQTGVTLTAVGTPTTALIQLAVIGGSAAVAAGAGLYGFTDVLDIPLEVVPGMIFGIMAVGAGSTHIVQTTMFWEEVNF